MKLTDEETQEKLAAVRVEAQKIAADPNLQKQEEESEQIQKKESEEEEDDEEREDDEEEETGMNIHSEASFVPNSPFQLEQATNKTNPSPTHP